MTFIKPTLLSCLLLLLTPLAFGHGAESAPANQHGGQAVKAPPYNLELVVDGSTLNLYVSDDHNQPLDASDAVVDVVVLANKKKTKLALKHQADNRLAGQGDFISDKKMKVIVYLQMPGAKKVSGRFSPLK